MDRLSPSVSIADGAAPAGSLEAALQALLALLLKGSISPDLSPEIQPDPRFQELLVFLTHIQRFVLAISNGDLSQKLPLKGPAAGSLKSFQASMRHLTWQAQMIAEGDFSQRIEFMGELSSAFNRMVENLEAARTRLQQREVELAKINADLLQEISEREWAEQALQERVRFEILLYQIGQAVASDLDLNGVLKTLQEKCAQILPFDVFHVAVYEAKTRLIRHALFCDRGQYTTLEPRDIRISPGLSGERRCTNLVCRATVSTVAEKKSVIFCPIAFRSSLFVLDFISRPLFGCSGGVPYILLERPHYLKVRPIP